VRAEPNVYDYEDYYEQREKRRGKSYLSVRTAVKSVSRPITQSEACSRNSMC